MSPRVASLFRIGVAVLLLFCIAPGARAQLHQDCTVSVLNRNVQVSPDGSWVLPNVPANFGQVRARATCVQNGVTMSGESSFFTLPADGVVNLPEIVLGTATPIPVSLRITPARLSFTAAGQTAQLVVTATYPNRSVQDVTAATTGTSYTTSNPALVTISADGLVTAGASGTVVIQATHDGAAGLSTATVALSSTDTDGDGIPDDVELALGLNPNNLVDAQEDFDRDGLTNLQEYQLGTDMRVADTDGDGLADGQEVALGTNPLLVDTDGDGIQDGLEVQTGSDPLDPTSFNLAQALNSIEVKPLVLALTVNTIIGEASRQLSVIGHLRDGTTLDLTSITKRTNYTSSNLATCNFGTPDGRVFGGRDGVCTITVTNSGFSARSIGTVKTFAPVALATMPIPGYGNNVDVSGMFAYVAAGAAGLQIVDVADPRHPRIVGAVATPGNANDVRVMGQLAFVADGSAGLQVIDISDPTRPHIVGAVATPGEAQDVIVSGTRVYVADGPTGLQIIEVSNPTAPSILGAVGTPGTTKGVDISGNVAVVADGSPSSAVRVIDVTNPASPQILGSVAIPGDAKDLAVRGTLAYVAALTGGLQVVDFSVPTTPRIVASLPSDFVPRDGELSGQFALFAKQLFPNAVPIVDISTPTNPIFRATLDFSSFGVYAGTGIALTSQFVYITGEIFAVQDENGQAGNTRLFIGQYLAIEDTAGMPPTVSMTVPAPSDTPIEGQTITLRADATDDIAVASVSFLVNGQVVLTDTAAPFETSFGVPIGVRSLTISAQAVDFGSNVGTATLTVPVIPDPGTTVVGRIMDPSGHPANGATITCLGVSGFTGADGAFVLPGVPTIQGNVQCTATFITPDGRTLTRTVDGGPPVRGGTTEVSTIDLSPGLLFSAWTYAVGVPGSGMELAEATDQVGASVFQKTAGGSHQLVLDGLALGIRPQSNIDALDVLADGSFIFSTDFVAQGVPGSAVARAGGTGLRPSNIYRSTGNGTNELFLSGAALGILPFSDTNLDALALLPDGSVLFSVQPDGRGVPGSALDASLATTLGIEIFRSLGDGTNTLFRSAAELGLVSGNLTGLVWNADGTLLFSVAPGTRGVPGSAVAAAAPETLEDNVFLTACDGMNVLFASPTALGIVSGGIDALASSPSPTADHQASAPTVTIMAPLPGQEVIEGDTLTMRLSVSDDVAVAAVDVVVGGTTAVSMAFPNPMPVVRVPMPLGPGPLTITAMATDLGNTAGTDTVEVTVIPDPRTTVVGRIVDPDGHPVAGATVTCLEVAGLTASDGTFSIPGVPTILGDVQCTGTFVTPSGKTLTGMVIGVPPERGGMTDVAQIHLIAAVGMGMVVDNTTRSVTVFDANRDTVLGTVTLGSSSIGDCAMTEDGTRGFVGDSDGSVWIIDLTTSPPRLASGTNPIPSANAGGDISLSPDSRFLVGCNDKSFYPISVINIATQAQSSGLWLDADCNAVEVLQDGSVLVTSRSTGNIRRLTLDNAGRLVNTGEVLFSGGAGSTFGPNNVIGAPSGTSGIVVRRFPREIRSFTIPGLMSVDTRSLTSSSGVPSLNNPFGISALVHPAGDRVYVRSNGGIDVFAYNSTTGSLGAVPLLSIPSADTATFFGVDQMAIVPYGTKLYVSQPRALVVYDANTGDLLTSLATPAIVQPTGVCFASPQSK